MFRRTRTNEAVAHAWRSTMIHACNTDPQGGRTIFSRLIYRAMVLTAVLCLCGSAADAASPTTEPLITAADMTYLGGFALDPSWPNNTDNTFQYGGAGLAYYDDPKYGPSLFVVGHVYCGSCVGEVQIPPTSELVNSANWSALPMAKTIQPLTDITHGTLANIMNGNNGNANEIYGLLVVNGRILVGANNVYSTDGNVSPPGQIADLAVQGSTDISAPGVFSSWETVGGPHFVGGIRSQAGWLASIPAEWQSLLGGDVLTGEGAISITYTTSAGASANVINSADVGTTGVVPGTTLIYYNVNQHAMCGSFACESTQNPEFNLSTVISGMVFVPGSRTLLFVGGTGTGPYCYGSFTDCGSTDTWRNDVKGPHAPPYQDQVWAYDANDLVKVKEGSLAPEAIQPYAYWPLTTMAIAPVGQTDGVVDGATIDPSTLRLYMTVNYGAQPRVEVWQITLPSATPASPTAPGNVAVH
jgi:hypothetical protein